MWLITPLGFFSIVQKSGDKQNGTLTVRARVRGDLVALKQHYLPGLGAIQESQDTDYRFRATAPRAEVSAAMARFVDDLDYSNFKSEVAKKQGNQRSHLYHDVWDVLLKLQTDPAFAEKEQATESYGGVVISGGGKVLLREPTNHHGGYAWTFAKTEVKPGESPRDTAIRAVREKTGYDARIRISVPGLYEGSSTSSNFYVMDAKHPPTKPNWQTHSLRWVSFDEARVLIRQSHNAQGRDRDQAILNAAEKVAGFISYKEHASVQPEDWNDLMSMSERHTTLHPRLCFTPDEMEKIQRGFYPTVPEQKWFIYFTGTRLRLHRSWTGHLYYDVGFNFDPKGGASVTDVIVNCELHGPDYRFDETEELELLELILRTYLLEPLEEPLVDGLVMALSQALKPNYLGSPEVVSNLLEGIFDVVIGQIKGEATRDDFEASVIKVLAAFTDDSSGYTRMPDWHTANQMGAAIKTYLASASVFQGQEDLAKILGTGMAALALKLGEILAAFLTDPTAAWEKDALVQLNAVHQFVVAVLLGTNTLTYGEKTLLDFDWKPVAKAKPSDIKVILSMDYEGGSLKLLGLHEHDSWKFMVKTGGSDVQNTLDELSQISPEDQHWVSTWRSALKLLDQYPWTQLAPTVIHSGFSVKLMSALDKRQKKGIFVVWSNWGEWEMAETPVSF
ncbi:NUDIX hydrolase [Pseudomonas sp. ACN5]|uniref:NUDIX hydrolase n=1 Tax=Pseudomonas sp. ACN5 TaxID=1920427 RepID=UPI000BB3AA8B|nr:NUDIX domain-containing protein [Pseudomonas sp. ACN5]PBJ08469.1 NUDIX domain protein [Pseudomonas sp. ACN5]